MPRSDEADLLDRVCLPSLRAAQNQDGGWGFREDSRSRVEPTAWALLALRGVESSQEMQRTGFKFLRSSQLPDGSWPASPGQQEGCWVTSLACWALSGDSDSRKAIGAALAWICADWPRDVHVVIRMIRKFTAPQRIISQNESLRGWGWTSRTASWVEPSAFALIALEQAPRELLPRTAEKRRELATALIHDRMCPGGGWNCGNPMVYGVPGEALVEPTVWALVALRCQPDRAENAASLAWLRANVSGISGPGSLALARICLELYGAEWPKTAPNLAEVYVANAILGNVMVMAWLCMALGQRTEWLKSGAGLAKTNADS